MKKILDSMLNFIIVLSLFILAIWCFWEGYAKAYLKEHCEVYITEKYGNYIKRTAADCELIKKFDIPINDDERKDTTIRN